MIPISNTGKPDSADGIPNQAAEMDGAKIYARIEAALGGRTWKWLSEATGIPRSTLADMRSGKLLRAPALIAVARALRLDLEFLLTGEIVTRSGADPVDRQLLTMFHDLSTREREAVLTMMAVLTGRVVDLRDLPNARQTLQGGTTPYRPETD